MLSYKALNGQEERGEVWSPGPLYNTIWVLRHPDRQPVVVHATKRIEVEYSAPPPPRPLLDPVALEKALDIRHRHVMMQPHLIKARARSGREMVLFDRPTDAEVAAAQYVYDWYKHNVDASLVYREGHNATVPLSDKRFQTIAKEAGDVATEADQGTD